MTAPTLTEFLLARIADDEAKVRYDGAWAMTGDKWKHYPEDAYNEIQTVTLANCRRVLAECEAKRRIVSRCDMVLRGREHGMFSEGQRTDAEDNLRALAAVYADHADYRDEWKP